MNPDFDAIYSKNPRPYGMKPSPWIVKILNYKEKPSTVLDVGICYGRNALFLAKQGFQVEGVDVSQVAINECLKESEQEHLQIKCYCKDIQDFKFKKDYDIIISSMTLQYLGNKDTIIKVITT